MITIIVDTKTEYDEMMEIAMNYMCRQLPANTCGGYKPDKCENCFNEHHTKCGIRVIGPVDNPKDECITNNHDCDVCYRNNHSVYLKCRINKNGSVDNPEPNEI